MIKPFMRLFADKHRDELNLPVHLRRASPNADQATNASQPGPKPLCGSDSLKVWDLKQTLTRDDVHQYVDSVEQGRPGTLCRWCVAVATATPLTDEAALINQAYPDRSAGRSCDICNENGSHHTDRHADMYAGARELAQPVKG